MDILLKMYVVLPTSVLFNAKSKYQNLGLKIRWLVKNGRLVFLKRNPKLSIRKPEATTLVEQHHLTLKI